MPSTTITEALAETKTITARIQKKREAIMGVLARDYRLKDSFASTGGSQEFIKRERQAVRDLEDRLVAIRCAIQAKNLSTVTAVAGTSRTVAAWLNWRRECSEKSKGFLALLSSTVSKVKQEANKQNMKAVATESGQPGEVIINLDEAALVKEIEQMETVLGELDGKLSLLNATTTIDV